MTAPRPLPSLSTTQQRALLLRAGRPPDTEPTVSMLKQASGVWREYQEMTAKLFRHSHVYSDIEQTMDRQRALELELQTQKESGVVSANPDKSF
jgi:hypothetical protein